MFRLCLLATVLGLTQAGVRTTKADPKVLKPESPKQATEVAKASEPAEATPKAESQESATKVDMKRKLRVCNAYPGEEKVTVFIKGYDLTADAGIKFKECRDLSADALKDGSRLDFKADGLAAGTFTVSDLPMYECTMVLVVQRKDMQGTAVSFQSHVFSPAKTAQVAIIDAYVGSAKSKLSIVEDDEDEAAAGEEVPFNSVLGVSAGSYEVLLSDGSAKVKESLGVVGTESYVVIRTGADDKGAFLDKTAARYPQDIVVYPETKPPQEKEAPEVPEKKEERSGAVTVAPAGLAALLMLLWC
eukprot:gb/GFBE01016651.1/.p1 GENE.gb/GFBE01016651.1/~~gb/GFBE01016651.1/.p1  ORF type:complete len:302 (+),score=99.51 gb/GFBE01016651.1/:1-906(+)